MRTRDNKQAGRPMFEGLEQRQFFSAAPMGMLPPPPWADGAMPPHPQMMMDGGFAMNRSFAMQSSVASNSATVDTAAAVSSSPTPSSFNGYPAATSAPVGNASSSMSLVNRAVDGETVSADDVRAAGFAGTDRTVQAVTPASSGANPAVILATPHTVSTEAPALPGAQIARAVGVFSSQPIRADAGESAMSAVTAAVRSAEQEIACVVRLAWADIAYTDTAASIGRFAHEAGEAMGRHAAEAELAAALVMGVAGAAWWVRENQKESAVETADPQRSLIEVF